MKTPLIALPLLLLVAAVIFLMTRPAPPEPAGRARVEPAVDWKAITTELESENLGGRVDESSAYGRYLRALESLDGPALLAKWDELQAADVPDAVRERLEPSVMGALMRTDVELALAGFAAQVGESRGGLGSQLFGGFRDLAERLPLKAALWLDRSIAAGIFGTEDSPLMSGEIPMRVIYERELIRSLLANGPDQAEARLRALPEPWRLMALEGGDSPQGQPAFARLVREFMTPEQQLREFARMASSAVYHHGAEGVEALLDQIQATPAERETILRQTSLPAGNQSR